MSESEKAILPLRSAYKRFQKLHKRGTTDTSFITRLQDGVNKGLIQPESPHFEDAIQFLAQATSDKRNNDNEVSIESQKRRRVTPNRSSRRAEAESENEEALLEQNRWRPMGSHDAYSKPAAAPKDQQRKTAKQAAKRRSRAEPENEDDTDSDLTATRQKRPYRRKGSSHNVFKYGGLPPMPALPADYKRETIDKILEMFHRSDYIIEGGGKEFMACPEAKADAYFDTWFIRSVAITKPSLIRESQEEWNKVIAQGDMSHVCHTSACENPFHIVLETHKANTSKEYCRRPMVKGLKCNATWDSLRLDIMQGGSHQPKCFSIGNAWMDSVSGRFGGVPAAEKQLVCANIYGCFDLANNEA